MENYCDISTEDEVVFSTGISEIDGVFSNQGGIVSGRIYFLTGLPGTGKTTISKKIQASIDINTGLYSRESSSSAVESQTSRLSIPHRRAFISDIQTNNTLESFLEESDKKNIKLVILDSIQEIALDYIEKGVSEESAMKIIFDVLINWINKNNKKCSAIIIGHVTKDGDYKGASYLLHKADAHIKLLKEGQKMYVTCGKNRLGGSGKAYYSFVDTEEAISFDALQAETLVSNLHYTIREYLSKIKKNKSLSAPYKAILRAEKILYEDDSVDDLEYLIGLVRIIYTHCPSI